MKKTLALLLAALILILTGCGADSAGTTAPETTGERVEAAVYFVHTDPAMQARWQALAEAYEAAAGIPVRVETVEKLPESLDGANAPTLVACEEAAWLEKQEEKLLDLSGTEVYSRMTTEKYNRTDEKGRVTAIAWRRETYGLLVNEALLEQAGYSMDMLMDYGMLSMIAADIHSRRESLGFDAFGPMSAEETAELAEQIVNAALYYEFRDTGSTSFSGSYLAAGRNFAALLSGGISEEDTARAAFERGEAVFLTGTGDAVLPLYCGIEDEEEQGLWESGLSRWAVNAEAPQVCIDAALDFLNWVVTGEEGAAMLGELQSRRLFDTVAAPTEETATVLWMPGQVSLDGAWLDTVREAMAGYLAGNKDWTAVEAAWNG